MSEGGKLLLIRGATARCYAAMQNLTSSLRGHMRRRKFITLVGGTAAIWPLATFGQRRAERTYQVGYLSIASREQTLDLIKAFEEGMRGLGYRRGDNVVVEYRFAKGEIE